MPLEILGPVVVAGIVAVVLMVWLFANHPPRLLTTPEIAESAFLLDYPAAFTSGNWVISDDNRLAVCRLSDPVGAIAMVEVMGSKHVTRVLSGKDIRKVDETGGSFLVQLEDFTLPTIEMAAGDTAKRAGVRGILESTGFSAVAGKQD